MVKKTRTLKIQTEECHYENACYDCGSTIARHHTPSCEMAVAEEGDVMDLPEVPGTQYWTGAKGGAGERIQGA